MGGRPHEVEVAEAVSGDVDALAAFFWEAWRAAGPDAPGFAGASDAVMAELTAPEALAARIGGPLRRMFLAREAKRVIGFAAATHVDASTVELAGIVVLADRAGLGIGSRLVEAAAAAMRFAGYETMTVKTEATNEVAIAFYTRRGFKVTGSSTEQVDGRSIDVVEFTRSLG